MFSLKGGARARLLPKSMQERPASRRPITRESGCATPAFPCPLSKRYPLHADVAASGVELSAT